MYSTSSKVQEIILLNRQLRNALSFRGGARKLSDFKENLYQVEGTNEVDGDDKKLYLIATSE